MVHRVQVGVARIFEMPSGASSQPAMKHTTPIRRASWIFCHGVFQRCSPRKMDEATVPAMTRLGSAPLPKGQMYIETRPSGIHLATHAALKATSAMNQTTGAMRQRRVGMYSRQAAKYVMPMRPSISGYENLIHASP